MSNIVMAIAHLYLYIWYVYYHIFICLDPHNDMCIELYGDLGSDSMPIYCRCLTKFTSNTNSTTAHIHIYMMYIVCIYIYLEPWPLFFEGQSFKTRDPELPIKPAGAASTRGWGVLRWKAPAGRVAHLRLRRVTWRWIFLEKKYAPEN